jgi:hypothetical protein
MSSPDFTSGWRTISRVRALRNGVASKQTYFRFANHPPGAHSSFHKHGLGGPILIMVDKVQLSPGKSWSKIFRRRNFIRDFGRLSTDKAV